MISLPRTLKSQVVTAITLLTGLFATSALYSMHVIDRQHTDDALVQLAARLRYSQQHLSVQAMRYRDNAPRDYPSYFRDLRFYFADLERTRGELAEIIRVFADNRFDAALMGKEMAMGPELPPASRKIAGELATLWRAFDDGLSERIGDNREEPRLEWAAEWITEKQQPLVAAIDKLAETLQREVAQRAAWANRVNRLLLGFALLVALGTGAWFYWRILAPLATAVQGFRTVANGNFAHRVPVAHDDEIGAMSVAFNELSQRLETLRRLLTRLEQGSDLAATLRMMSETLPTLMPVDWIGVLVIGVDGRICLKHAFSDGRPDTVGELNFEISGTVLSECIETRQPLHIADVAETSRMSERFVFLRELLALGRRDAIFLPIGAASEVQGVAVFASRYPNSYRTEHLELLRNIGVLVGVSLARTIQLAEHRRLATIGQFASGIAHEIRNPLATISLALDHLREVEGLPANSGKRVVLASNEVSRLEHLLSDMLLYAKPLALHRAEQDACSLLAEVIGADERLKARIILDGDRLPCPAVAIDGDRMRQVLLNLLHNAVQASPAGEPIHASCRRADDAVLSIEIRNGGPVIGPEALDRLFEPFFTTRTEGTGLGLPIAQRIVCAHGGALTITSNEETGTTATIRLPIGGPQRSLDDGQAAVGA